MSDSIDPQPSKACPICGTALSDAAGGLCPRCLMADAAQPTNAPGTAPGSEAPSLADVTAAFPQFAIIELIGTGGMGTVWRARQPKLNRHVALKLLPASLAERDPAFAERFEREGQLLARLHHPNIVTVHDSGLAGNFFYIVMEFVDGVNLRQAMRASRFTPQQALAIVPKICDALQYAHEEGVLHRDIKPENILLDAKGRVKLADFGIAKLITQTDPASTGASRPAPSGSSLTLGDTTLGTPNYMAPEQIAQPADVDHRADIYSLGVVFYELLTGELPRGKFALPSEKSAADPRLDGIVQQALEKERDRRQQSVGEMRTQVETVVSTPGSSRGNEAPSEEKDQSLLTSAATGQGPRFLKVGTSILTTPELLATAAEQFFAFRTRGQLILDDRQLTHSRAGVDIVIPLAAIRDLSIGRFPRAMAPVGTDLISVTYEEGSQPKQVLLLPMAGWFGFPSTVNAHVAEWFAAIREAITAATGRVPASTPADRLGVPRSSPRVLALVLAGPLMALFGFFIAIPRQAPGAPTAFPYNINPLGVPFALALILPLIVFGLLWLRNRRRTVATNRGAAPPRPQWRAIGLAVGIWTVGGLAVLLVGFLAMLFTARHAQPSGATLLEWKPVSVSDNVVLVEVTTEARRGSVELRADLAGPKLPREVESALDDSIVRSRPGTLVKPTPYAGNQPSLILPPERQVNRLRFVLPTADLAQEAFRNVHATGVRSTTPGQILESGLFAVSQSDGEKYRASLQVGLPVTSADPNWVSVTGHSQHDESAVTLTWEVLASRPGMAWFSRAGSPIIVLQPHPQTKLYGVSIQLELTRLGTDRVLFVWRIGGRTTREEFPGNFRDLADELRRTASFSAKTVRGASIELCQWQGKSFTVQVDGGPPTTAHARRTVASNFKIVAVVVVLLATIVGIVFLIVLVRKGGTAGKVVMLLLLLLAAPFIALLGWRAWSTGRALPGPPANVALPASASDPR